MLFDRARIFVQAGAGGDGCLSFRREAHVPHGGPDGGDGGRGGAVILRCDDSKRDLQSFKRSAHYKAPRGGHGQGAQRHGADGDDLVVSVPPGTQITSWDGTVHDLVVPGSSVTIASGGSGGRGNRVFATATRQAPRFRERGLEGTEGWIQLELKLLADVGLVGLPNAGKSSLLSRMTRADPKVASYPFTTLEPMLGTIDDGDRQLIVADIPGLIEGASDGAGLGHDFLAHVERTRLLVHVLDLAPLDGSDPEENFAVIEAELAAHDARLASLPRILALSKADLVTPAFSEEARARWHAKLNPPKEREEWEVGGENPPDAVPVLVTSSATRLGLEELSKELLRRVPVTPGWGGTEVDAETADVAGLAEHRTFRPAAGRGYTVEQGEDGVYRVTGDAVETLLARHDIDNEESMEHVEHRLRRMGVIAALDAAGFTSGDDVEIAGILFELD